MLISARDLQSFTIGATDGEGRHLQDEHDGDLRGDVADPDVRETLFERLISSDLLEAIRDGGPAAADMRIEALLARVKPAAPRR